MVAARVPGTTHATMRCNPKPLMEASCNERRAEEVF
jgi:hypothetical protein